MDIATIDQNYQQLEQESSQVSQAIQGFATKLQAAGDAGSPDAREWILDLKSLALQIQQEQLQVQALLQALHGFVLNAMQPPPPTAPAMPVQPAVYAPAPQAPSGGLMSHFSGSGFGQAMTQGMGMGAGFGIADSLINSIFGR